jgi:hypothetical protein
VSRIVFDIREGVVIFLIDGEKQKIINRGETGTIVIDPMDNPEAEKPDPDEVAWTPFVEVQPQLGGTMHAGSQQGFRMYQNNVYTVLIEEVDEPVGMMHLSIRRNDRHWTRDWRHFQRIKNELVGEEREAVELYPAESRLVDAANQYHLWVAPEGNGFSFGYQEREVEGPVFGVGGRQRPFIGEEAS